MINDLIDRVASKCSGDVIKDGKVTSRWYAPGLDRYYFDFSLNLSEWRQYDTEQDAHYFGVWVNVSTRQVLTYAEGDIYLLTCLTQGVFKNELERMACFYGDAPPAATILDGYNIVNLFDPRPVVK